MIRTLTRAVRNTLQSLAVAALIAGSAQAQTTSPPAYSATALHRLADGTVNSGTVVKSGPDMRLEYSENGQQIIQIIRRAEGVMYMLYPAQMTYFEMRGTPSPDPNGAGYMPPCQEGDPALSCTFKGNDVVSGITAEVWEISTPGQPGVTTIVWDGARHRALRQTYPDGSTMQMAFQSMEMVSGRSAEFWSMSFVSQGQPAATGEWYYDPELRVELREVMPGGESRTLENILVGPVDPALFTVPQGWTRLDPPQEPGAAPPTPGN